ncbi:MULTISPECIES: Flp family type IVb pilin [unclassified Nocardioides]|uniref:Flp family type IVb pilin n=1 Tax=unclassified Nocardioides TaxID=2615069 RepID=UPI0009F0881B|nr:MULTISPECIES: Flp family type IVb pilin [unclassified Nocardioides]GAW52485.1 Flp/Fap pilin component [Nocardioides sp. PD653-B2]GAW54666.1 Flp/Fap pilin component [Nocardioides sp. PD653]
MMEYIRSLVAGRRERTEDGASAVEYGLLVGGIAAVVVVLVFALGGQVSGLFDKACTDIDTNSSATSSSTATC